MKIKCKECGKVFEIPDGICTICFSDILGEIMDIKNGDDRLEKVSVFINELTTFDYKRGLHNAKCKNQLDSNGIIRIGWEEVDEHLLRTKKIKYLKGFIENNKNLEHKMHKPRVKLIGEGFNSLAIVEKVSSVLKKSGLGDQVKKFREEVMIGDRNHLFYVLNKYVDAY